MAVPHTFAVCLGAMLCSAFGQAFAMDLKVPEHFPTIQRAIDTASAGDTVVVGPGTYRENLLIQKPLVLRSARGAKLTIVDGQRLSPVIMAFGTGSENVVISGFTVTNGLSNWEMPITSPGYARSGAIYLDSVRATIIDNVIVGNTGCIGAAIGAAGSSLIVLHNKIHDNTQDPGCQNIPGGGILMRASAETPSVIADNVIARNHIVGNGAGIAIVGVNDVTIQRNEIRDNDARVGFGGALHWAFSNGVVSDNTLVGNRALEGGAIALEMDAPQRVYAYRNTILDNAAEGLASAVRIYTYDASAISFFNNSVRGNSATALIDCEPFAYSVSRTNLLRNKGGMELSGLCTQTSGAR
jgi:parallel beta-helix repeat protein